MSFFVGSRASGTVPASRFRLSGSRGAGSMAMSISGSSSASIAVSGWEMEGAWAVEFGGGSAIMADENE